MHRHPRDFRRRRAAFFAGGLREGLRVVWTGTDGPDAARAELAGLGDVDVATVPVLERLLARLRSAPRLTARLLRLVEAGSTA